MKASEFFPKEITEVLRAADKNTPMLANMASRMTLRAGLFLAGFLALAMSGLAEVSTKPPKEALLIANGKYSHFAGLAHPGADASKLSAALEQLGFRVRVVRDGSREQMLDAISEFERGLRNTGAIAFFHYGGHGVQVHGKNYLLPADADIPDERRVATRAVALDEVMTAMDAAAARASIIVIDACRDNPLPAGSGRNLARGLSVVGLKPKNSIVIYAAEAGSKALDGLFTPILANSLQQKGRTINQIMISVRSEVYAKSSGQQTPGEYNQLFEELFLGEMPEDKMPEAIITATPSPNPDYAILPEVEGKETFADLKIRAEQGDADAQKNLGNSYYNGEGVAKNPVEAVKWWRKAADQGYSKAQYNLGIAYAKGEGVAKDALEAVNWYRKAAERGIAEAQYNLGVCYDDGEGVPKNAAEASKWYRKAAEQGHADAQCILTYEKITALVGESDKAFRFGDYDIGLEKIREADRLCPNDAGILLRIARFQEKRNETVDAASIYNTVLALPGLGQELRSQTRRKLEMLENKKN